MHIERKKFGNCHKGLMYAFENYKLIYIYNQMNNY